MLMTELSIPATIDLYYDLYVPRGADGSTPLMIAVHGYGAHKRYMMREAREVAEDRFVIASIEAPHPHFRQTDDGYKIGYGWLSDKRPEPHIRLHHHFVDSVIDRCRADGTADADRVVLIGFSQACALNFRYAFTFPDRLAAIVGICGGIPGDLESNEAYKPFPAETFYLYGDDDEFYSDDKFKTFDESLRAKLTNYRSKQYNAKHEITDEMRRDISTFLDGFCDI